MPIRMKMRTIRIGEKRYDGREISFKIRDARATRRAGIYTIKVRRIR